MFDEYESQFPAYTEEYHPDRNTSLVLSRAIRRLAFAGLVGLSAYGALWMKNNGINPLDLLNPVPITHQVLAAPAQLPTLFSESPLTCKPDWLVNSPGDSKYEGVYYFPGELNSSPRRQVTTAHYYSYEEGAGTIIGNGEPFDPMAHTAASWFYPFDTWVKVTRADNPNIFVLVRINDRGPDRVHHPDVGIDLAEGAMRALDPNAGSLEVIVEPVDCPIR